MNIYKDKVTGRIIFCFNGTVRYSCDEMWLSEDGNISRKLAMIEDEIIMDEFRNFQKN